MGKRSKSAAAEEPIIEIIATNAEEVGLPDDLPTSVGDLIVDVAAAVVPSARATGAAKYGVQFGVRVRRDGSATLADEGERATIRVFLEWPGSSAG